MTAADSEARKMYYLLVNYLQTPAQPLFRGNLPWSRGCPFNKGCIVATLEILFGQKKDTVWQNNILGDPGAVIRTGRKGATKVFTHGRKSPWVPTLTEPFPNGQTNAGSWLGTKNALYYFVQSANSISWVLFVCSYTTAIVSAYLSAGSFTKVVCARETFIFYLP